MGITTGAISMTITNLQKAVFALALGVSLGTAGVLFAPATADAQARYCTFSRDLWLGSMGEDVRCLQRFLNSNGFTVATWGPGSPGYESTTYGPRTMAAVALWQRSMGYPVSGTFTLAAFGGQPYASTPLYDDRNLYNDRDDNDRDDAREAIDDAEDAYEDAKDEYDDARDDNRAVGDAKDFLDDARDDLRDARKEYRDGDYDDAVDSADDAEENADDALDEISGSGSSNNDRDDARDAIEDAEDAIDEAEDEIDEADDRGRDTDDAEDLLEDAEDKYDDAVDAFDDKNYSRAVRLAEDAEELAEDAIDEL